MNKIAEAMSDEPSSQNNSDIIQRVIQRGRTTLEVTESIQKEYLGGLSLEEASEIIKCVKPELFI